MKERIIDFLMPLLWWIIALVLAPFVVMAFMYYLMFVIEVINKVAN